MLATTAAKECLGCGETLPLEQFQVDRSHKDGHRSQCRTCRNASQRLEYARDPAKKRESIRRWEAANRERSLAYRRRHYAENRAHYREKGRKWYQENRERADAYIEQWRRDNVERHRAICVQKSQRRRARQRAGLILPISMTELEGRWAFYGARCWMCGDVATQWDHVKPIAQGGPHMLANLRPACGICNARKRDRWPLEDASWR
jgi:5-methylcytosine-specific restriction endonuclease McrA